ncbi:MAG: radical SAM protein [Armatimonadetes bacterium]|nr:radical SAM protein [Armatimonadota bacterium]
MNKTRPFSDRALLSRETHLMEKPTGKDVHFGLVFPNTYHVGMSNLGFQTIYGVLARSGIVCVDRAFFPEQHELLRGSRELRTLESGRLLRDLEILGFSISFELDYLNFLDILRRAGIPLLQKDRREGDPLIMVGGAITFFNPEPLAHFTDLFVLGDGEETVPDLAACYRSHRHLPRSDLLAALARVEGAYVPSLHPLHYDSLGNVSGPDGTGRDEARPSMRRKRGTSLGEFSSRSLILTPDTEFADMYIAEVSRGCTHFCNFCVVGYRYRPFRPVALSRLLSLLEEGLAHTDRIGLLGAAVSDYRNLSEVCEFLIERKAQVSFSSLRSDTVTPAIARALQTGGRHSITIAPEVGDESFRFRMDKTMTDEDIRRSVEIASDHDLYHLKAYYMIGLPDETEEDLESLVEMVRWIRQYQLRRHGRKASFKVSINSFVPKPGTPLQWHPQDGVQTSQAKMARIRKGLGGDPRLRLVFESPRLSAIQGILSRGGRDLAPVLLDVLNHGQGFHVWKRSLDARGISLSNLLYRQRDFSEIPPWQHLLGDDKIAAFALSRGRALRSGSRRSHCASERNIRVSSTGSHCLLCSPAS